MTASAVYPEGVHVHVGRQGYHTRNFPNGDMVLLLVLAIKLSGALPSLCSNNL